MVEGMTLRAEETEVTEFPMKERNRILMVNEVMRLLDERDRRYTDHFAASDKYNAAIYEASKVAITKAESTAQEQRERANEFRGQLSDQAATLMPRKETETSLTLLREQLEREVRLLRVDITVLREARSIEQGASSGKMSQQGFYLGLIPNLVMATISVISVIVAISLYLKK